MQNLKKEDEDEVRRPEIASRISRLRRVLRELRLELYLERLNLQREHRSTAACWSIFRGKEAATTYSIAPTDILFAPESEFDVEPSRIWNFHSPTYQSNLTISERYSDNTLRSLSKGSEDLDLELASFYKRKICDLEADCCAGLNRIRSWYTQSLGSFEDTEPSQNFVGQESTADSTRDTEDDDKSVKEQKNEQLDAKSVNERLETLWTTIDDPFSQADLSSLINETSCANECLPPSSQIYQELMLPLEPTQTNLAF